MGILSTIFGGSGSNNLLNYCYPLMVNMADEQQRTFLGLVQVFCEDNSYPLFSLDNKTLFKSRLIVTMMVPFAYGARGLPEKGYNDLIDVALEIANRAGPNYSLLNKRDASHIANTYLSEKMINMASSYQNGNIVERYCSLIVELLTEIMLDSYGISYNHQSYMHLIYGNMSITVRRSQSIISNIN
jgi:hypothetical protein